MTFYAGLFYVLAAATLFATGMAVTRRVLMHGVIWMSLALFATALIFFLLGAPLLAVFEVIVYAGAIMVLFLFVIMLMQQRKDSSGKTAPLFSIKRLFIPLALVFLSIMACVSLLSFEPSGSRLLTLARSEPRELGAWLMGAAWPAVEAVSVLLLAALAGVFFIGRRPLGPILMSSQPSGGTVETAPTRADEEKTS
ncbi:NADH-quinone oxidoreductase subunit J family protein [Desulfovibrio inopinatus]|uniref:NADH-quinone oxidoreductase subunit J family protein n=1 Tax=Desulfovibrio inopinatus TaxID=102109 RepID=UPI0006870CAE|nr:NADH-quinone oxidoreductase subunit J [Desulfovibrio inopinatus]